MGENGCTSYDGSNTITCMLYCEFKHINHNICNFAYSGISAYGYDYDSESFEYSINEKPLIKSDFYFDSGSKENLSVESKKLLEKIKDCFDKEQVRKYLECKISKNNGILEACCTQSRESHNIFKAPVKGIWQDGYFGNLESNTDAITKNPLIPDLITTKPTELIRNITTNLSETSTSYAEKDDMRIYFNTINSTDSTGKFITKFISSFKNNSEIENISNTITTEITKTFKKDIVTSPNLIFNNDLTFSSTNIDSIFESNKTFNVHNQSYSDISILITIFSIFIILTGVLFFIYRKMKERRNYQAGRENLPMIRLN